MYWEGDKQLGKKPKSKTNTSNLKANTATLKPDTFWENVSWWKAELQYLPRRDENNIWRIQINNFKVKNNVLTIKSAGGSITLWDWFLSSNNSAK